MTFYSRFVVSLYGFISLRFGHNDDVSFSTENVLATSNRWIRLLALMLILSVLI